MQIIWGEQSLRWFHTASEYTGYNKKMAQLLLKHIPCRGTLCDMGCGAGLVDLELASRFRQITCVDISPVAVESVAQDARQRGIGNIETLCADGAAVCGSWDTVMALFHGGTHSVEQYLPLAKDRLILVTHGHKKGNFGPQKRKVEKPFDIAGMKEHLDELGLYYHLEEGELEYGQPFREIEDAKAFVQAYSAPLEQGELEEYLEQNLQKTGEQDWPYYLPSKKKFGIFVIRRDENEKFSSGC